MDANNEFVVFIPLYNASETIVETLKAIDISAGFANTNIPVFIYDDCSKDNSYNLINSFKGSNVTLHCRKNENNLGQWTTCNKGFVELSGGYKWAFLMHADDIPKKEWLSVTIQTILKGDRRDVFTVWSSHDTLVHNDSKLYEGDNEGSVVEKLRVTKDANLYLSKVTASWHVSGAAVNLKLYEIIGRFDSKLAQYGDTDFFARGILKGYSDIYIRQTLVIYRIITSSESFVSKNTNRDIKEMLYLVDKFKNTLNKYEKNKILSLGIKYGIKRCLKFITKGKFSAFSQTVSLTAKGIRSLNLL
jgi:glycosyltransferase involved in cell wall biosynthesis